MFLGPSINNNKDEFLFTFVTKVLQLIGRVPVWRPTPTLNPRLSLNRVRFRVEERKWKIKKYRFKYRTSRWHEPFVQSRIPERVPHVLIRWVFLGLGRGGGGEVGGTMFRSSRGGPNNITGGVIRTSKEGLGVCRVWVVSSVSLRNSCFQSSVVART